MLHSLKHAAVSALMAQKQRLALKFGAAVN